MAQYAFFDSPSGKIRITSESGFITGLDYFAQPLNLPQKIDDPVLVLTIDWLNRYFSVQAPDPAEIPVKLNGTPFQLAVWNILKTIPYGHSVTYGNIARQLSPTMSAQAVGGAVGKNPVSILIPCHRVLGTGGNLTGYAGGLDKKRFLLDLEGIVYK